MISSILGPLDFTFSIERVDKAQPGLGIYRVRNVLLSSNSKHQIGYWMFQVYDIELWIIFLAVIVVMILLLSLSHKSTLDRHRLLEANVAAIKAVFAQSFDQEIFLKVNFFT